MKKALNAWPQRLQAGLHLSIARMILWLEMEQGNLRSRTVYAHSFSHSTISHNCTYLKSPRYS